MKKQSEVLSKFVRQKSDVRTGKISDRKTSSRYEVTLDASGEKVVAVKGHPDDEFRSGQKVRIQLSDASKTVLGAGPTILTRSPVRRPFEKDELPQTQRPGAIIPGKPPLPASPASIWVTAQDSKVYRVDPTPFTLLSTQLATTGEGAGITKSGLTIFARFTDGELLILPRDGGQTITSGLFSVIQVAELIVSQGKLWSFPSAATFGITEFAADGSELVNHPLDSRRYFCGVWDGTYWWIGGTVGLIQWEPVGDTVVVVNAFDTRRIIDYDEHIYTTERIGDRIAKIKKSDLTRSVVFPYNNTSYLFRSGTDLYFLWEDSSGGGDGKISKIDLDTFTVTATLGGFGAINWRGITGNGGFLYAIDTRVLHEIDLDTFTVSRTLTLVPSGTGNLLVQAAFG